ncbi:hypothetical protein RA272_29170, partial [Pseudomonas syringae pv. tagetis]|uniref:hypothetical protein n=1 Tax=Pseudomonas syringae group genomosp. 7 TaxID=251699 RepID=UPI00376FB9ED
CQGGVGQTAGDGGERTQFVPPDSANKQDKPPNNLGGGAGFFFCVVFSVCGIWVSSFTLQILVF